MEILFVLALGAVAMVLVPLILLKLVFWVILLPFKLVGLLFKVAFGVVGLVGSILMAVAGAVFGVIAVVLMALLIPLLPLALVAGGIWLLVRASRPQTTAIRLAR